jgi:hypothetical protein
MAWTMNVATPGIGAFINRLEKFDKDVSKELKKDMRKAAGLIAKSARARQEVPMSHWARYRWIEQDRSNGRNLQYNLAAARQGIRVNANRYRASGVTVAFGLTVVQKNPAGAIFELAGSENKSGHRFNRKINELTTSGPYPRTLFPAYYDVMPTAVKQIQAAIRNAERKVGI